MKAIVEWGQSKSASPREVCGTSAKFVAPNATQAAQLASQLYFQAKADSLPRQDLVPTAERPRLVVWSPMRDFWIAVSLLDGNPRGDFAGIAERESKARAIPKVRLQALYKLWEQLGDIPVNDEGNIESPFLHFNPGAYTLEIWTWFEEQNDRFIVGDVQRGIRQSDWFLETP